MRDPLHTCENGFGKCNGLLPECGAVRVRGGVVISEAQWLIVRNGDAMLERSSRYWWGEVARDALERVGFTGGIVERVPRGAPLFGFAATDSGRMPVSDELAAVRLIIDLRQRDPVRWSFRAIAHRLRTEGHKTKKGGAWVAQTVKRVWDRREAYANALRATEPPTPVRTKAPPIKGPPVVDGAPWVRKNLRHTPRTTPPTSEPQREEWIGSVIPSSLASVASEPFAGVLYGFVTSEDVEASRACGPWYASPWRWLAHIAPASSGDPIRRKRRKPVIESRISDHQVLRAKYEAIAKQYLQHRWGRGGLPE